MAYTRKYNKEQEEQAFPTRLRQLTEGRYSQAEIAKYVGCTPQAIGSYMRGETIPKITDAVKIADFLNVSLDYLSGRTDIISPDTSIQGAHEITGISEKAITMLDELNYDGYVCAFLSGLIEHRDGTTIEGLSSLSECIREECEKIPHKARSDAKQNTTLEETLEQHKKMNTIFGYLFECQNYITRYIKDSYMSGGTEDGKHQKD